MFGPLPDAERETPFLEAGTEVIRPVDGIEHRDPAGPVRRGGVRERLLSQDDDTWNGLLQQFRDPLFDKNVGLCDRTAVSLPFDVEPQGKNLGQHVPDKVDYLCQNGIDVHPDPFRGMFRLSIARDCILLICL